MTRLTCAVFALAGGVCAPCVLADDLTPPPWRGQPLSTFQHWSFVAGAGGGPPDAGVFNPYGVPNMVPTLGTNWLPAFQTRADVWLLGGGGSLQFDIPNNQSTVLMKELWLQITFFQVAAVPPPTSVVSSPLGNFGMIGAPSYTVLPNGWMHELTRWSMPNGKPPFERITISPALAGTQVAIDQVVVDTISTPIPTPGAIAMLGLAGLVAGRRRR